MNEELMQEEVIDIKQETGGEYLRQLSDIQNLELGSKEYAEAVKGAATLGKLTIDFEQQQINYELEMLKQEREQQRLDLEKEKFEEEKVRNDAKAKQDKVENRIKIGAGIGVPLVQLLIFTKNWTKGLKFEELGTITSASVKALLGKMIPKV